MINEIGKVRIDFNRVEIGRQFGGGCFDPRQLAAQSSIVKEIGEVNQGAVQTAVSYKF